MPRWRTVDGWGDATADLRWNCTTPASWMIPVLVRSSGPTVNKSEELEDQRRCRSDDLLELRDDARAVFLSSFELKLFSIPPMFSCSLTR